jgi:molybdopterin converting factor small subunit
VAVVRLPALLAAQAGGTKRFALDAATVGDALRALPVADLVLDERGALRRLVNVYVDGQATRDLGAPLAAGAEVRIVQAVAGG